MSFTPGSRQLRRRLLWCSLLCCNLLCCNLWMAGACAARTAPAPLASGPHWVTAWEAAPQSIPQGPAVPSYRRAPLLGRQTLRMIVVPELSGGSLRLRLSNRWGDRPLPVAAAGIGAVARGAALVPGTLRALRFSGHAGVVVPPHGAVWSDALAWPLRAGHAVALSLYLRRPVLPTTWHRLAGQVQYLSTSGDQVDDPGAAAFRGRLTSYLWLDRIDVRAAPGAAALVAIGDSITDGMRSTLNARRSWPQQLAARLRARGVRGLAVLNAGISGNRLLSDSACWGPALRERFGRDALHLSGVRAVVVLIGINDIDFAATPRRRGLDCDAPHRAVRASQLQRALAALAARAHRHGLLVYGATLPPASLPPPREALRTRLDAWIRASRDFDGVIDFDAVLRDPADPHRMRPRFDSGDHLHPSDAGYAAMAAAALGPALRVAARSSASH